MAAAITAAIALFFWFVRSQAPAEANQRIVPGSQVLLASPGRVEGYGETISLGAATDGIVKTVFVTDGQKVAKGTVLAVIGCEDIKEEMDQAKAKAVSAQQARIRLLRGRREEERKAAAQNTAAAQAILNQTQEHLKRMNTLYQKEVVARDLFDQANRDYEVAQANYQSSRSVQDLVDADPLPEEKAGADADVMAAEKNVNVAMQKLQKCTIRAPISGTVLRVTTKVGESYSTLLPRPLFSLADDSSRRVRAEVDEEDIGKVTLGQRAIVSANGFQGRRFDGRIVELAHLMGRKTVFSGDPAEKVDRDILEVIIELDQSAKELPIGLRVTAQFY